MILTYDPKYQKAFVELNLEWIKTHFEVEPMDVAQLEDPNGNILNHGGEIFFVVENGVAVGTCALVPHGENSYELAKMAVSPSCRGKGYGDQLMSAAIEWAKKKGAAKLTLLSNTVLTPAITLYKKFGFVEIGQGHPDYKRCNIEMELDLKSNCKSPSHQSSVSPLH
jgi:GNAT superfamily N-acetyltransferase